MYFTLLGYFKTYTIRLKIVDYYYYYIIVFTISRYTYSSTPILVYTILYLQTFIFSL